MNWKITQLNTHQLKQQQEKLYFISTKEYLIIQEMIGIFIRLAN